MPIVGVIQRNTKQVIAYPVEKINAQSIGQFINKHIYASSLLVSDKARAYIHHSDLRIDHSKGEYVSLYVYTNNIENYWALLKRAYMGVFHWWSTKHLHRYVFEFNFRFNNRKQSNISFIKEVMKNSMKRVRTFSDIRK